MSKFVSRFMNDESGATAIEYGLIAALMAVALIAAFNAFTPKMKGGFDKIGTKIDSVQ